MANDLDRVKNVAVSFTAVEEGEEFAAEVEGGWVRKSAPCDGFVVTDKSGHSFFVPRILVFGEGKKVQKKLCSVQGCSSFAAPGGLCLACQSLVNGEGLEDTASQAWRNVKACADRRKKPR
jgi:hypothetical protein